MDMNIFNNLIIIQYYNNAYNIYTEPQTITTEFWRMIKVAFQIPEAHATHVCPSNKVNKHWYTDKSTHRST